MRSLSLLLKCAVTHANEVTLLIAAATSYRRFDDVSGDPESIVKAQLDSATRKSFDQLRYGPVTRDITLSKGETHRWNGH